MSVDTDRASSAEGRDSLSADVNRSDLIDALQYWGSVSGKMLREWGMDELTSYRSGAQIEAWLIGSHVIEQGNANPISGTSIPMEVSAVIKAFPVPTETFNAIQLLRTC